MGSVFVHGLSIKPGKPAVLGKLSEVPFVGLPGFPVSTHIVFDQVVISTLLKKYAIVRDDKVVLKAKLTKPVISSLKIESILG